MKAVVYHGPRNVSVDEVPDPKIEKPTDALARITATNICGSDLHMYEVAPTSRRAASSAMRTSGKSSGSAMRSTRSKSAT